MSLWDSVLHSLTCYSFKTFLFIVLGFVLISVCITCNMAMVYQRSNEVLKQISADIPSNIVAVDLSFNTTKYLRKTTFVQYQKCTHLDLHCNCIEEIKIGAFSSFVNIEMLRLNHNKLQRIKPEYFTGLQSLRTLSLGYNQIRYFRRKLCYTTKT